MSNFHEEVWDRFTGIDVKPLISTNNKIEYITWSKVWRVIMETYPASTYTFEDRRIPGMGENGPMETVEVSCTLNIVKQVTSGVALQTLTATRTMHLPCMQSYGQFLAIENPTARHISDTRMRCLVKTAAMFGLGLTMWSGDEFQAVDNGEQRIIEFAKLKSSIRMALWKTAMVIKESYEDENSSVALEAWRECSEEEMKHLWLAESKGGFFTTKEKEWIRKLQVAETD